MKIDFKDGYTIMSLIIAFFGILFMAFAFLQK